MQLRLLVGLHRVVLLLRVDLLSVLQTVVGTAHVDFCRRETYHSDFLLHERLRKNLLPLTALELRILSLVLLLLLSLSRDLNGSGNLGFVLLLGPVGTGAVHFNDGELFVFL